MMNDIHLKYLLAVYKYRNLSKAAEQIHITRQSLSKIIADIEHRLGKVLFIRTQTGLMPTDAMKEMVPHIQLILSEYENLFQKKIRWMSSGKRN